MTIFHALRIGVQVVNAAVLARLLAPDDFGLFAIAMIIMSACTVLIEMGLSAAAVQSASLDHALASVLFAINVGLGLAATIVVCVLAAPIGWIFGDDRLAGVMIAASGVLLVSAAGVQHAGLLTRTMRFHALNWANLISQFVGMVAAITLALAGANFWALVIGYWVSTTTHMLMLWMSSNWLPSVPRNWGRARSLASFGVQLTSSRFLELADQRADKALVGWRWGTTEIGFYSRAYTILMMVTGLLAPLQSVMVSALSRLQSDASRWRAAYLDVHAAVSCVGLGTASVLVCTAHHLLRLIYGPGWERTGELFFVMSFSVFAFVPLHTLGWLFVSLGQPKRLLMWSAVKVLVVVVAVAIALPFGPMVVAAAWAVAMLALYAPGLAFAARQAPVSTAALVAASAPFIVVGALSTGVTLVLFGASPDTSGTLVSVIAEGAQRGASCGVLYVLGALVCLTTFPHFTRLRQRIVTMGRDRMETLMRGRS